MRDATTFGCVSAAQCKPYENLYDSWNISHWNLPEEELNEFENEFCNELIFSA